MCSFPNTLLTPHLCFWDCLCWECLSSSFQKNHYCFLSNRPWTSLLFCLMGSTYNTCSYFLCWLKNIYLESCARTRKPWRYSSKQDKYGPWLQGRVYHTTCFPRSCILHLLTTALNTTRVKNNLSKTEFMWPHVHPPHSFHSYQF